MFQTRNFLLIIVFALMYMIFFTSKKSDFKYMPITGTIFDVDTSTQVLLNAQIRNTSVSTTLFTDDTRLPTIYVYSDLTLPEKFTAKTVQNRSLADFIIISEKTLEQKFVYKPELEKPMTIPAQEIQKKKTVTVKRPITQIATKTTTTPKEKIEHASIKPQEIVFSQYTLRDIVKESQKTYFYADKKTSTKNVQLSLISYTPYKDKSIIKFAVSNNQLQNYFFIATVSILSDKKPIVDSKTFFDQFVSPGQSIDGYAVIPITSKKNLTLQIVESGGDKRCLEVNFLTP